MEPASPAPPPPPAERQIQRTTGLNLTRPAIVAILYLATFAVPFTLLVGLILAYIWRRDADTEQWELSHFTYLIRTFWIAVLIFAAAVLATFGAVMAMHAFETGSARAEDGLFLIGMLALGAAWLGLAGWFGVRCVLSLVRSSKSEPMRNPGTLLF